MSEVMGLQLEIRDNSERAIQGLNGLAASLEKIKGAVSGGLNLGGISKQLEKLSTSLTKAVPEGSVEKLEKLAGALERLKAIGPVKVSVSKSAQRAIGMESVVDQVRDAASPVRDAMQAMESGTTAVESALQSTGDSAESLKSRMFGLNKELFRVPEGAFSASGALGGLRSAFSRVVSPVTNFASSLMRVAKYRFMRTIIKEITQGIATGLSNLREYSAAVGTSFATDMENASNALLKMKNSIGAAIAPALQALIPILQTIVSWVIAAANAINQFLSLLTGKSQWTRAKDASESATKALGGAGRAAKKADDEIKGLLADWDELNIIQQESNKDPSGGGGGGGVAGIDYSDMFEEVTRFDSKIRKITNWIKKNWDDILSIVKLIGAAILAWKVSSVLGGIIGTLSALAAGGLILAVDSLSK